MEGETKLSALKRRIAELGKIDPSLTFTPAEQERRNKIFNRQHLIVPPQRNTLTLPREENTNRRNVQAEVSSRHTFTMNTEYYGNSIQIISREKVPQVEVENQQVVSNSPVVGVEEKGVIKLVSGEGQFEDGQREDKLPKSCIRLQPVQPGAVGEQPKLALPLDHEKVSEPRKVTFASNPFTFTSKEEEKKEESFTGNIFATSNPFKLQINIKEKGGSIGEGYSGLFGRKSEGKSVEPQKQEIVAANRYIKEGNAPSNPFEKSYVQPEPSKIPEQQPKRLFSISDPFSKAQAPPLPSIGSLFGGPTNRTNQPLIEKASLTSSTPQFGQTKSSNFPFGKTEVAGLNKQGAAPLATSNCLYRQAPSAGLYGTMGLFGTQVNKSEEKETVQQSLTQMPPVPQSHNFFSNPFSFKSANASHNIFGQKVEVSPINNSAVEKVETGNKLFGADNYPVIDKEDSFKANNEAQQSKKPQLNVQQKRSSQLVGDNERQKEERSKQENVNEKTPIIGLQQQQKQDSPVKQEVSPRQISPKKEILQKPNQAIGPGGKKFDLLPTTDLFSSENKGNIFGSNPQQETAPVSALFSKKPGMDIFGDTSAKLNLFGNQAAPTGNIFSQNYLNKAATGGLFSQGNSSGTGGSVFNSQSQQQSLFGNTGGAFFSQQPQAQSEEKQQEDGQDDAPIEAEENIDPTKSTGRFDYIQTTVIFKQPAVKFRQGSKQVLENVTVSLQRFADSSSTFIFVRLANKCIAFNGKLLPGTTQIRILNDHSKNLQIKRILYGEAKAELVLVKIQLKDDATGSRLLEEVEKVVKK